MSIRSPYSLLAASVVLLAACAGEAPKGSATADLTTEVAANTFDDGATCGRSSGRKVYLGDVDTCMRLRVAAPAGGLTFFSDACGCGYAVDPDAGPSPARLREPEALASAPSDPFTAKGDPFVQGDVLVVPVEHGGGCRPHGFDLLVSTDLRESMPPRMQARVVHAGFEDACFALYRRELRFDLAPLREHFAATYHAERGTLVLDLGDLGAVRYVF